MTPRLCCCIVAVLIAGACAATEPGSEGSTLRYDLVGTVVSADAEHKTVMISHEAVVDYMSAMTMPFNVADAWVFDAAEPGARVRATLIVQGASSWLEDVIITNPAARGAAAEAVIRVAEPGVLVPVIEVINQDGERFGLDAYRGSYFAFTFIYTRCPLPDFCPRMSESFRSLFDAVEDEPERFRDLRLLSLSIDPLFDTVEVLRQYGERYLDNAAPEGFERWQFASAEPPALREIGEFTGLRFMPENGELLHSLRTVLVDPEGTVVKGFVGNDWDSEDLLGELERHGGTARPDSTSSVSES